MKFDIIILAGKSKMDDPLLDYIYEKYNKKYESKVLIEQNGVPFLRLICDALHESPSIGDIYIAGLTESDIELPYPVHFLDLGKETSTVDKIEYWINNFLLKKNPVPTLALIMSGDIPAVKTEYIEDFISKIKDKKCDFHYGVVEQTDMERVFPGSNRSYAKLKDGNFCGSDIFGINPQTTLKYSDTFRELTSKRKSFLKQAFFVAPLKFVKIVLRRATLQEVVHIAEKALKMSVNIQRLSYPELAMDIDKPFQYEIVKKYLENEKQV